MAFDDSPKVFFGNDFAAAGNAISFNTSDAADVTVGTFTVVGDTTAQVTVSATHNLRVGDLVALSTSGTLPAGFSPGDYYVVAVDSTTVIQLSATIGGTPIAATDTGTGTHTISALSVLRDLDDADAHATTGDSRTVIYALMEMIYQKYSNTPADDRAGQISVGRASRANNATGALTRTYTVSVALDTGVLVVTDE